MTGYDPRGASGIVENELGTPLAPRALAGLEFFPVWATSSDGSPLQAPDSESLPYWPGAGETRFLLVRWAPRSAVPEPVGDLDALAADAERQLPGLMGAFEPDDPGFHTSNSVDYGLCLEGEMWLRLDGETERKILPGTCVVQRGTRHKWENRSDAPATMLFVLIGADRTVV
ncbi:MULTISPECIES: cupin domain-containing protein [Rhodococcus]|uniref:cupin domain-containing protein n=1 Tax=Rhodococcus globerulus TaxID=33008 RepID=UPI001C568154|nr:cupin domain-containing protein [Rhodococcus globerulus]QXW00465.1 cupin domain-containing protein [Rhodococcus globerulus]